MMEENFGLSMNGKRGQVIELLAVMLTAVVMAIIAIGGLIYTFGPQGFYLAKNVVLSPNTLSEMATRQKAKVFFDSIEFSFYDSDSKQFKNVNIGIEKYAEFYKMVQRDRSLSKPVEDLVRLFVGQNALRLTIEVKGKNGALAPFQEIDFITDFYRVKLHQDGSPEEWAYFYHPGIKQRVLKLFYG